MSAPQITQVMMAISNDKGTTHRTWSERGFSFDVAEFIRKTCAANGIDLNIKPEVPEWMTEEWMDYLRGGLR